MKPFTAMWMLSAVFGLGGTVFPSAQTSDSEIRRYLEESRPDGEGPGIILARAEGQLTGTATEETAVLYTYQIGESQDRTHRQYLVVFTSSGRPLSRRTVGGVGRQYFTELRIQDGQIVLDGMAWDFPGDAMCCPSLPVRVSYEVWDDDLVAVGTQ